MPLQNYNVTSVTRLDEDAYAGVLNFPTLPLVKLPFSENTLFSWLYVLSQVQYMFHIKGECINTNDIRFLLAFNSEITSLYAGTRLYTTEKERRGNTTRITPNPLGHNCRCQLPLNIRGHLSKKRIAQLKLQFRLLMAISSPAKRKKLLIEINDFSEDNFRENRSNKKEKKGGTESNPRKILKRDTYKYMFNKRTIDPRNFTMFNDRRIQLLQYSAGLSIRSVVNPYGEYVIPEIPGRYKWVYCEAEASHVLLFAGHIPYLIQIRNAYSDEIRVLRPFATRDPFIIASRPTGKARTLTISDNDGKVKKSYQDHKISYGNSPSKLSLLVSGNYNKEINKKLIRNAVTVGDRAMYYPMYSLMLSVVNGTIRQLADEDVNNELFHAVLTVSDYPQFYWVSSLDFEFNHLHAIIHEAVRPYVGRVKNRRTLSDSEIYNVLYFSVLLNPEKTIEEHFQTLVSVILLLNYQKESDSYLLINMQANLLGERYHDSLLPRQLNQIRGYVIDLYRKPRTGELLSASEATSSTQGKRNKSNRKDRAESMTRKDKSTTGVNSLSKRRNTVQSVETIDRSPSQPTQTDEEFRRPLPVQHNNAQSTTNSVDTVSTGQSSGPISAGAVQPIASSALSTSPDVLTTTIVTTSPPPVTRSNTAVVPANQPGTSTDVQPVTVPDTTIVTTSPPPVTVPATTIVTTSPPPATQSNIAAVPATQPGTSTGAQPVTVADIQLANTVAVSDVRVAETSSVSGIPTTIPQSTGQNVLVTAGTGLVPSSSSSSSNPSTGPGSVPGVIASTAIVDDARYDTAAANTASATTDASASTSTQPSTTKRSQSTGPTTRARARNQNKNGNTS